MDSDGFSLYGTKVDTRHQWGLIGEVDCDKEQDIH